MTGSVAILNVGAGDTKLSFDRANPSEAIRAARIVKDMLRRGYALLVEVERNGEKAFERALDFREDTSEYIIADFDPVAAYDADTNEMASHAYNSETRKSINEREQRRGLDDGPSITSEAGDEDGPAPPETPAPQGGPKRRGRPPGRKAIPASGTRAVAVARSAGG